MPAVLETSPLYPPVISGIQRINLKNGCSIVPGSDGSIYGITSTGTRVNLTNPLSADFTVIQQTLADIENRLSLLETHMSRAIALMLSITGVNISTQSSV
jgi:hypothetical protein